MGCSNSKVDNEEGVARCKQRKRLMKQTVTSRHNLAASHALYVISLKGVGSAFRQFAEGEVKGDIDSHTMYSTTETPNTPRTPPLKLTKSNSSFSPSPPPPPLSPQTRLSALKLHPGSPITRAVSSPESVTLDFLPPPPPNFKEYQMEPTNFKEHRMEHTPPATIKGYAMEPKEYRMEHTPPVNPTKIYRFEDSSTGNSYMKTYRMDDSSAPPPLIQPIEDDWRFSGRGNHSSSGGGVRGHNPAPPPPPPVTRSSWQDLFMDPFRPAPASYSYMEERRSVDAEAERKSSYEAEMKRKREMEERRMREMEQKRLHEMELQRREKRPPPVKIVDVKPVDFGVPDLEEEEIPELEDVDEDIDIDGPPPPDFVAKLVKQPETPPAPKPAPPPEPKVEVKPALPPEPKLEVKPEPKPEPSPEPQPPPPQPEQEIKLEPAAPKPKPETPPPTPPKAQGPPPPPPKAAKAAKTPPGKPPKPEPTFLKTNKDLAVVMAERGGRDLLDVLKEVDDCFLRAAQCGDSVSRILEIKKTHYHSSFSDGLRVVGESARMNFWKLSGKSGSTSFRTSSNMSSMSNMSSVLTDDSPNIMSMRRSISNMSSQRFTEECGLNSHAASLDRLFAWEKKLYLEVKQAEALRVDLERKVSILRNQDAKNEDHIIIDKTRSTIKALQTRMVVAIQAVDNGYQQVQKLRDEELYPQLLELLDGMGAMWREMSVCHQAQLRAVEAIRRLDNSAAFEPTTSSHRHATSQLELALNKWSEALNKNVHSQREYLKNLTSWLRLSLMQFGSDEMDDRRSGSRSPSRSPRSPFYNVGPSPIYELCQQWQELLDRLADKVAVEAIGAFAGVVREMLKLQMEELRIKKRVENYERELERREQSLHAVAMRDPGPGAPGPGGLGGPSHGHGHGPMSRSPTPTSGSDMDDRRFDMVVSHGIPERTEVAEKRMKYETTRQKLDHELDNVRKAYTDTRTYTLNSLQAGLPHLFQAVITFVNLEADVYDKLNK